MSEGAMIVRTERRWQMALAVLVATGLQVATPHAGRVPVWWIFPVLELILLAIIIAIDPGRLTIAALRCVGSRSG